MFLFQIVLQPGAFSRQRAFVLLLEGLQFVVQLVPGRGFSAFGFLPRILGGANRHDLLGACKRGGSRLVRAVLLDGSDFAAGIKMGSMQ